MKWPAGNDLLVNGSVLDTTGLHYAAEYAADYLPDEVPQIGNGSVPPESVTPQNEAIVAMATHLGIDPVNSPPCIS